MIDVVLECDEQKRNQEQLFVKSARGCSISISNAIEQVEDHLISWGSSEFNQNGHGLKTTVSFNSPALIITEELCHIIYVACGSSHSIALTDSGSVFAWGSAINGQLGIGEVLNFSSPRKIFSSTEQDAVANVYAGGRQSFILLYSGKVLAFGNNVYAQLGYDFREKQFKENQLSPTVVSSLLHRCVRQVACGERHTLFRFDDGQVAVVGDNAHGQIGSGDKAEAQVPKILDLQGIVHASSGANHCLCVDKYGQIWQWGYGLACGCRQRNLLHPERVHMDASQVEQVVATSGGQVHSMALTVSGVIFVWGSNRDGQLGLGRHIFQVESPTAILHPDLVKVVRISAGELYSAAITDKGRLYMWGRNSHVIDPDGSPNTRFHEPVQLPVVGKVRDVSCGAWHAAAIVKASPGGGKQADNAVYTQEDDIVVNDLDTLSMTSEMANKLPRQNTMTIGEFYAPTPQPAYEKVASDDEADVTGTNQGKSIGNSPIASQEMTPRHSVTWEDEKDADDIANDVVEPAIVNGVHGNKQKHESTNTNAPPPPVAPRRRDVTRHIRREKTITSRHATGVHQVFIDRLPDQKTTRFPSRFHSPSRLPLFSVRNTLQRSNTTAYAAPAQPAARAVSERLVQERTMIAGTTIDLVPARQLMTHAQRVLDARTQQAELQHAPADTALPKIPIQRTQSLRRFGTKSEVPPDSMLGQRFHAPRPLRRSKTSVSFGSNGVKKLEVTILPEKLHEPQKNGISEPQKPKDPDWRVRQSRPSPSDNSPPLKVNVTRGSFPNRPSIAPETEKPASKVVPEVVPEEENQFEVMFSSGNSWRNDRARTPIGLKEDNPPNGATPRMSSAKSSDISI